VLAEDTQDDIDARLEMSQGKSKQQETSVSRTHALRATKLLNLIPKKTTIHALKKHDPVARVNVCNLFLQSALDGEADPQLMLFLIRRSFPYNRYWNAENPKLTYELLRDVRCAISARKIIYLSFAALRLNTAW
jgi:hypothetical protein